MFNKRRINFSMKIYFCRSNVKPMFSLFSLAFHSSFFLDCICFLFVLDWLSLIFCAVSFFVLLFLSFPMYSWNTFIKYTTEEEQNKVKSRTEVDIEVSWWIADLRANHLHAVESTRRRNRVNSKRDTLE